MIGFVLPCIISGSSSLYLLTGLNKLLSLLIGCPAFLFLFVQIAGAAGFSDETVSAGLNYLYLQPGSQFINPQPMMGGGAAAGDFDGDGWVDLYVTRMDDTDILFRNNGDGTFEDVSANAGFTTFLPTNGAAWGDIDNDGCMSPHFSPPVITSTLTTAKATLRKRLRPAARQS